MPSSQSPTSVQLAAIAAKLDPALSPDDAIARAQALWEAAERRLRATQIADEEEASRLYAECERRDRLGLGLRAEKISMSQAFEVQCEFAKRMRVSPYKSKKRFADALRKAAFTVEKVTYGMTEEEWRESAEPDMPVKAVEELTSVRAVEELFEQKIEQRRKRDRTRKAAGRTLVAATAAKENFKKTHGNFQARNAEQRAKKTERQRK